MVGRVRLKRDKCEECEGSGRGRGKWEIGLERKK